tara:strand:+ start:592 stop:1083 length:492 start_codon:yes stop_codon:yes gene_type:complete
MESYALREKYLPNFINSKFILEIGSGAGVSLIERFNLNKNVGQLSIDLPDTIIPAYLYLKSVNDKLRICLPDNSFRSNPLKIINDFLDPSKPKLYDVIFITPDLANDLPKNSFDHAFNAGSFQEMDPIVVKNYMKLIERTLKPGCFFESNNNYVSRYIKGNNF